MKEVVKRFFQAKGNLRFKLLYALDYESEFEERNFFVASNIKAGEFAKVTRYGNIYKLNK